MDRGIAICTFLAALAIAASPGAPWAAAEKADPKECFGCHDQVEGIFKGGKHTKVNCASCHQNLRKHADQEVEKPETRTDHAACGACHPDQVESLLAFNVRSPARVEKSTFKSRSPLFDTLIMPHGFSKEHAEPRSHVFMLVDHYIVDRAYGGRFQLKDQTRVTDAVGAGRDAWEVLVDREPSTNEQKRFMPQTATAANPVCLNCKTQDHILKWNYLGDPGGAAKWSRTSNVVDFARDLRHALNCFMCHDPHSGAPRVVRDGLIEATVDRGMGSYPLDKEKSERTQVRKVTFRDFRAVGYLSRSDSNLMCAQCHVEYNCNPGFDPATGEKIGMDDRRTNHFPWTQVLGLWDHYQKLGFNDFKHAVTGASLTKLQHPESETFWGSRHERAGVECKNCHMPRMKGKKGEFTFHGQRSVRYFRENVCAAPKCHPSWTAEESSYQVDAIQNYIRGKITKAEYWLGRLIDAYTRAKDLGVPEEALAAARVSHSKAHILWEWWTAENSDGFHNPALARESLTQSITVSQDAIAALEKAIAEKIGGGSR